MSEEEAIRLQKFIAQSGFASRRRAERLITSGLVRVNGAVTSKLGVKVLPCDRVEVGGRFLKPCVRKLYLALHKPRGFVCSRVSSEKFPSYLSLLPDELREVHNVGRLDVASEGLLLATNDGEFTHFITHPRFEVRKEYEVDTRGRFSPLFLKRLCEGVSVDGELLRFVDLRVVRDDPAQGRLSVQLIGGKNREIRRLLDYFDLQVVRLRRVRIGEVRLGGLGAGAWRHLRADEVKGFAFRYGESR
ncbi:MAG: Ribosomal large subunit pseudouridine synthase B [Verrucomicrobia subdivision 3 bacterium]|nr:Ribosomal large subunit pseudouridine synthase B [Limisphaerales bacterium]MCS1415138.1 Ribosomal large subunit pseudouridine synthase B [Limisphaerales bacterium]